MRRSTAPSSLRRCTNFVSSGVSSRVGEEYGSSTKVTSNSSHNDAPFPNAVRSTESILNLLSANCEPDLSCGTSNTVSEFDLSGSLHRKLASTVSKETKEHVYSEEDEKHVRVQEVPCNKGKRIFNVVWGKQSKKKHKTWEGDGILEVGEKTVVLKDTDGKILGQTSSRKTATLEEGSRLFVGSKEVEIIDAVNPVDVQDQAFDKNEIVNSKRSSSFDNVSSASVFKKQRKTLPKSVFPARIGNERVRSVETDCKPLVMPSPTHEHQWQHNPDHLPVTDVKVDMFLTRVLRTHQRLGVVFMYQCVMGMQKLGYYGSILADEMGLGKTLQCITLVWMLLKQGPYGGQPVLQRVLIVTPSSLVTNWHNEFLRWTGRERIKTYVVDQKNKPKDYIHLVRVPVMLISYEMFVRCYEEICEIQFDLIVCDEGHRLKNTAIRTYTLLSQIKCKRRILLTGTPIQNDLQELYALVNFINPGILGSSVEFRRYFEEPILASRQPSVEKEVRKLGEERAMELNHRTSWFILRRTQEVIDKYLPKKQEMVVFCRSTPIQQAMYEEAVDYWLSRGSESGPEEVPHLGVITALKKICNHPVLIKPYRSEEQPGETLDMLASICEQNKYKFSRLDGSTPTGQRLNIVKNFNSQHCDHYIFLLSARAGGIGLNLTGASRLVLYDSDWNPATDLQAMSRIWRDGQSKCVFIYRLLTAGTIEEKIYQRQLSKTGLSGAVVDPNNKGTIRLSTEELKDLFTFHHGNVCMTHEMMNCVCTGVGFIPTKYLRSERNRDIIGDDDDVLSSQRDCQLNVNQTSTSSTCIRMNQLFQWQHYTHPVDAVLLQDIGLRAASEYITFIFRNLSS
ncbi:DNA repair and recombination protein RAD54B-like isoform X2 [Periplaneta americana]|uniref:DNA repair and recombination protein RAD54B-like isoform X2 n=1 Tax=Periplaneta americana TaxID=6978 RepID=UPI0037E7981B